MTEESQQDEDLETRVRKLSRRISHSLSLSSNSIESFEVLSRGRSLSTPKESEKKVCYRWSVYSSSFFHYHYYFIRNIYIYIYMSTCNVF